MPAEVDRDRFGLPKSWTLLTETDLERMAREQQVRDLACEAFATAARHFTEDEARRLFKNIAKPTRGRKHSHYFTSSDLELLATYDCEAIDLNASELASLPRLIAQSYTGHSVEATEKKLRRLLIKRKERVEAERRAFTNAGRPFLGLSILTGEGQK